MKATNRMEFTMMVFVLKNRCFQCLCLLSSNTSSSNETLPSLLIRVKPLLFATSFHFLSDLSIVLQTFSFRKLVRFFRSFRSIKVRTPAGTAFLLSWHYLKITRSLIPHSCMYHMVTTMKYQTGPKLKTRSKTLLMSRPFNATRY